MSTTTVLQPTLTLRSDSSPPAAPTASPEEAQKVLKAAQTSSYPYAHLLPEPNPSKEIGPPLTEFTHHDPALRALKFSNPREIFESGGEGVRVEEITPGFGSEVFGVDLTKLDRSGRDQVGLEVARRGVVVFRDQSFGEQSGEWLKDWGRHYGRLHVHPTSAHPEGHPEFHLVYRDSTATFNYEQDDRMNTLSWHSDVSYEIQPPGLTTLFLLDSPESGGDTLYADMREAYRRLSPPMQAFLEGLSAVHSGVTQAAYSKQGNRGGVLRREPVENIHPLIRTHPVTGEKTLYINEQFTTRIVGLKKDESEILLKFLYDHVARGGDFQARIRWKPNTVVLWDNRIMTHSAIVDFKASGHRRHGVRITPQAEKPSL